jgi:hypothetical protein
VEPTESPDGEKEIVPISEVSPTVAYEGGPYNLQITAAVPDSGFEYVWISGVSIPGNGMPSEDPRVDGALDDWFQALVDHIAAFPTVVDVSIRKTYDPPHQDITPTPPE